MRTINNQRLALFVILYVLLVGGLCWAVEPVTLKVISAPTSTATTTWTTTTPVYQPLIAQPVTIEGATSTLSITVDPRQAAALTIETLDIVPGIGNVVSLGADTRVFEIISTATETTADILWMGQGAHSGVGIGAPIVPLGSTGVMEAGTDVHSRSFVIFGSPTATQTIALIQYAYQ